MMDQTNMFEMLFDTFKITNPIRLIELFAGVGSQAMALRNIGADFEHYKISEWEVNAIKSYKEIHINDDMDYSSDYNAEELASALFGLGISNDGKKPMELNQIKRKGESWLRETFNNIKATNNFVDITKIHAEDLGIIETNKYTYLLTYSFPCQDLSKAGKQRGMEKGSGTRSGLLWEVERILEECDELPQVLLMENVPDVIGIKNIKHFQQWQTKLEELGYTNYVQVINAKNQGIPQNRERCFMVSILGDYYYEFPKDKPLKLKLKDMLEPEVDEKYFLSDKMLKCFTDKTNRNGFIRGDRFKPHDLESEYAYTVTTGAGNRATDNFIKIPEKANTFEIVKGGVLIPEATKKGYALAEDGDGVYISRPHQKRGVVQKSMIPTLKTSADDIGVVISGIYTDASERFQAGPLEHLSRTLKAEKHDAGVTDGFRIRKLTPLECWRLMGFTDEDFEKASKVNSNRQLYKQAGNSIVVNVLEAIFRQLL